MISRVLLCACAVVSLALGNNLPSSQAIAQRGGRPSVLLRPVFVIRPVYRPTHAHVGTQARCCRAFTAYCLACILHTTPQELCAKRPNTPGCIEHVRPFPPRHPQRPIRRPIQRPVIHPALPRPHSKSSFPHHPKNPSQHPSMLVPPFPIPPPLNNADTPPPPLNNADVSPRPISFVPPSPAPIVVAPLVKEPVVKTLPPSQSASPTPQHVHPVTAKPTPAAAAVSAPVAAAAVAQMQTEKLQHPSVVHTVPEADKPAAPSSGFDTDTLMLVASVSMALAFVAFFVHGLVRRMLGNQSYRSVAKGFGIEMDEKLNLDAISRKSAAPTSMDDTRMSQISEVSRMSTAETAV